MQLKFGSPNQKTLILIILHSRTTRNTLQGRYVCGPFLLVFLLKCTDAFPGSISDADITEQSCVLDTVTKGKTVMTDKGFNITDICHEKGLLHNRPPMKFSHQFDETEVVKNFNIATLRIYIKNYIGRIRHWQILSKTWPSSRIDLLGCCFQIFAHIVNMLKKPVGPK